MPQYNSEHKYWQNDNKNDLKGFDAKEVTIRNYRT